MSWDVISARGPLWATPHQDVDEFLSMGRAALLALALECAVPLLVFGIDWSFLHLPDETVIPVMSVRLDEPPREAAVEPPPPIIKPREQERPTPRKERKAIVPIELPMPLPHEVASKIVFPKSEPEVEQVPKVEKKLEPEMPPLPSVFRDVKPVKKVKPVYPPDAEAQHIQGRVKVRLSVNLDGTVADARLLYAEPAGIFDEAVLTAVRQYIFKKDGTSYHADQEIIFKIDN